MNSSQINRIKDQLFRIFAILCTAAGILVLGVLLYDVCSKGLDRLSWEFLANLPSRFPEKSGIYTALYGMVWLLVLTILISFPIGIGAGLYLEEYGKRNRMARFIEVNIRSEEHTSDIQTLQRNTN